MFFVTAGFYVVATLPFLFFSEVEVQKWAIVDTNESNDDDANKIEKTDVLTESISMETLKSTKNT